MSQYFRWIVNNKKDDVPYVKRRSNSLDPRSLEASGINHFLNNQVGKSIIKFIKWRNYYSRN